MALVVGWALWPSKKTEPHSVANVATSHANEDALSLTIKKQTICAGGNGTVALKSDGTVINTKDTRNVLNWEDIVSISTNGSYTVGLKANGTVVAALPQSSTRYSTIDDWFSDWKNVVEIDCRYQDVALVADGTVIGNHDTSEWSQIVSVSAGEHHVVGLKADGTVLATKVGSSSLDRGQSDVSDWEDIVALSVGANHTVGLKADGTVVATGDSRHGQCAVSDWQDIIAISAGDYHAVGLKSNGTVVATKITATWSRIDYRQSNVSDWTDIVAISAGTGHTVGLKADGTVVATGHNEDGQCNISDWTDIRIPGSIK